jgi:DNA-binding CsgD family transcriptional regulator
MRYHALGDAGGEWHALMDLGKLWAGRDYRLAGDYFARARERARSLDDPRLLAHSLNRVGNWLTNIEQPAEAGSHHREALDIFTRLNDRRGEAETLDLLAMLQLLHGDLPASADYLRQAVAIFTELGNLHSMASSLSVLAVCSGVTYQDDTLVTIPRADLDGIREGEMAMEIVRSIGWRAGEAFNLFTLSYLYAARGDYTKALSAARESLKIAEEVNHEQWKCASCFALGAILTDLYNLDEARAVLERGCDLARNTGSLHWIRSGEGFLAWCLVEEGDLQGARKVLEEAGIPDVPMVSFGQRRMWHSQVLLLLAEGNAAAALRLIEQLDTSAHGKPDPAQKDRLIPRLSLLRGQALYLLGSYEAAEAALLQAVEVADLDGLPGLKWRSYAALGKLYDTTSRHQQADHAWLQAQAITQKIAEELPVSPPALKSDYLEGITAQFPKRYSNTASDSPGPRRARPGGLTAREIQVVSLVAQGKSNREIADELVLGERTVETHLENARSKLGFVSRVQLATWALEQGIK